MAVIFASSDSSCGLDFQPVVIKKKLINSRARVFATYTKETVLSIRWRSYDRLAMIIRLLIFKSCSGVKMVSRRACPPMQFLSHSEVRAQVLNHSASSAKWLA